MTSKALIEAISSYENYIKIKGIDEDVVRHLVLNLED